MDSNNYAQLYFILGRVELRWKLFSIPEDDADIHRFSNRSGSPSCVLLENL